MAMVPAEQTDSQLQKVLQLLNTAIVAAQTLSSSIGSVKMALQKIESEQKEIERVTKSNGNLDPETTEEIRELKRNFRCCTSCAKVFLSECVYAAKYGLDKEIEKEIKEELEKRKLDTLQSFFIHFVKRLEQSKQQLENFNSSQAEANEIATEMTRRYKDKLDKITSDTNAAKGQLETATLLGNVATGTKLVFGTALIGSLMMISWRPQEALLIAMVSGAVAYGSFVFEHVAAARDLGAMNVLTGSMTDQLATGEVLHSIRDMETFSKTDEKQCLAFTKSEGIPLGLEHLRKLMSFILQEIGNVEKTSPGAGNVYHTRNNTPAAVKHPPRPEVYSNKNPPYFLHEDKWTSLV